MLNKTILVTYALSLLWCSPAFSHTAWLVSVKSDTKDSAQYQVYFGGHEGKLESYPAEKVKDIKAIDEKGEPLTVWRTMQDNEMQVRTDNIPAILLMHFDNGIYTRNADGESVNVPMSEVDEALSAVNAIKYHKTIGVWSALATKAQGQPFEIVPMNAQAPKAGKAIKIKVLIDGKPAQGIEIGTGENTAETKTNADGIAEYIPTNGFNKIWAGKRTAVVDNPNYTELSIEYLLTFTTDDD
jgi:nickel transport protein